MSRTVSTHTVNESTPRQALWVVRYMKTVSPGTEKKKKKKTSSQLTRSFLWSHERFHTAHSQVKMFAWWIRLFMLNSKIYFKIYFQIKLFSFSNSYIANYTPSHSSPVQFNICFPSPDHFQHQHHHQQQNTLMKSCPQNNNKHSDWSDSYGHLLPANQSSGHWTLTGLTLTY